MLKKFLLASCVFGLTTSVWAADITNPFYLPKKNQVGSITSVVFDRNQAKMPTADYDGKAIDKTIYEELQYGLTDTVSFIGGIGNTFNKSKGLWGSSRYSQDSDGNFQYSLGMAWNVLTGPTRLQLSTAYNRTEVTKSIYTEAKAGYQLQKFLPYVSVGEEFVLDNKYFSKKPMYNAKIGVYQGACEVWGLDTGIRWVHDELGEQSGFNAEAEASYYLNPKAALSVYGTYLLDGKEKYDGKLYEKSIGMKLRWFFN